MVLRRNPAAHAPRRGSGATRLAGTVAALVLALVLGAPLRALGEDVNPSDSVFELFTYTKDGKGVARGTAFFTDPSGLALALAVTPAPAATEAAENRKDRPALERESRTRRTLAPSKTICDQ